MLSPRSGHGLLGGALSAAWPLFFFPSSECLRVHHPDQASRAHQLRPPRLPADGHGGHPGPTIIPSSSPPWREAAEEIGLDAMLVKAGALYHDIGK